MCQLYPMQTHKAQWFMDGWQRKLTLILACIAELQIIYMYLPALLLGFIQQISPEVSEIHLHGLLWSELLVDLALKYIITVPYTHI